MAIVHILPPEPWGRQMTRAREDVAGLKHLQDAVDRLAPYMLSSTAAVCRLEQLVEPPPDRRRRALAAALVFLYGLDPRPFGVGRDDLPPAIYAQIVADSGPSFAWTTADELRQTPVAA
jgi:hypothetical protein